ncbi:Casparian strip membrane protein [Trema orientale]|uniref:CASP-like protein n=1 Tax=Trema orientale TaxID=63057 RepID=A0A2P5FX80_TREOI|nr:Casparian strip membrane protein [Trema orientale]
MEMSKSSSNNGELEKEVVVRMGNKRGGVGSFESLVRLLAMALTLSAAVILGVDKQTKIVSIKILDTLPPVNLPATAKWHYLSAFTYFVVVNAIACSYAAVSLVLLLANRGGKSGGGGGLGLVIVVVDMMMVALLFSSNGAAAAIGLVGYEGNSHVQWKKVCNVFGKFCDQGAAALVISLLGAITFLLLVMLAIKRLH